MSANRSMVWLVAEASKTIINKVIEYTDGLDAGSMGPDNIGMAAVADSDPNGPIVGRYGHSYVTEADAAAFSAMKLGTMPAIMGTWGEDGLPTEQEAIDAFASDFEISVKPGDTMTPNAHLDGMLFGMGWSRPGDTMTPNAHLDGMLFGMGWSRQEV